MRIAYLISAYPLLSQTFIVNEMTEMQEAGQEIILAPLHGAPKSSVRHQTYERLHPVALLPCSLISPQVILLALLMLLRRPIKVLKVLAQLHLTAGLNIYAQIGLLAITPKALATAWRLRRKQVDRIHSHFATHTATCAAIIAAVTMNVVAVFALEKADF